MERNRQITLTGHDLREIFERFHLSCTMSSLLEVASAFFGREGIVYSIHFIPKFTECSLDRFS